jgi:short-subunit dehydrogenase
VPQSSIYAATKFGLRGFALSLRQDLRGSGVGVSVVMPGFIRDAGMFAETGYRLPPGVGTKSPGDVASAVIAAVEHNRAELDVAPLGLRAAAAIAAFAPGFAERASRLLGSHRIAAGVTARQRDQR